MCIRCRVSGVLAGLSPIEYAFGRSADPICRYTHASFLTVVDPPPVAQKTSTSSP